MSSLALRTVTKWQYDDIAARAREAAEKAAVAAAPVRPLGATEEEVKARVAEALAEAERQWKAQTEAHNSERTAAMICAMERFAAERASYFRRVEAEVVELSLAIARKVLEREAALDPTLLSGLVKIALDRMGAGATVRVRVPAAELPNWGRSAEWKRSRYALELAADDTLQPGECVVETDLGSASFGFGGQLKEIEAGLLSILAQRPDSPPAKDAEMQRSPIGAQ